LAQPELSQKVNMVIIIIETHKGDER